MTEGIGTFPSIVVLLANPIGGICGFMLLDQRFEFLEQKLEGIYDQLPPKTKEMVLSYWQERVKPSFVGTFDDEFEDVDYFIPIPGVADNPSARIEDGFMQLTRCDMKQSRVWWLMDVVRRLKTSLSPLFNVLRSWSTSR